MGHYDDCYESEADKAAKRRAKEKKDFEPTRKKMLLVIKEMIKKESLEEVLYRILTERSNFRDEIYGKAKARKKMGWGPKTLEEARTWVYGHYYGKKPKSDFVEGRCIEQVSGRERWASFSQCARKAVIDGCWCKQHDPAFIEKKRKEEQQRWEIERLQRRRENFIARHGYEFYEALVKISEGHNNARGLATEILKETGKIPES